MDYSDGAGRCVNDGFVHHGYAKAIQDLVATTEDKGKIAYFTCLKGAINIYSLFNFKNKLKSN